MQDLTELDEGDEVHITLEAGKTIPLTVGNVRDSEYATLQYEGQNYADVKWAYAADDYDWTLIPRHGDDGPIGISEIEVV